MTARLTCHDRREDHHGYGRDGRRLRCLEDLRVEAVERELVEDAIAGHTPGDARALRRFLAGIDRLARVQHRGSWEEAFVALDTQVRALNGGVGMADPYRAQLDEQRAAALS